MPLSQCIAQHSHREYLTWQAWLEEQWNKPDRTDHYLMRVALEVASVLAKNRGKIKLEQFKLEFEQVWTTVKTQQPSDEQHQRQQISDQMLGVWLSRLGVSRKDVEQR